MNQCLRILHLESDPQHAEMVRTKLVEGHLAHEIIHVNNMNAFAAALADTSLTVILSDWRLPEAGGIVALKLAREHNPLIPFIFVAKRPGEDAVIEAFKEGAADFVLKDDINRLVPIIRLTAAIKEKEEKAGHLRATVRKTPKRIVKPYELKGRGETESSLHNIEELLHFVLENSPDTIFIQDRDLRYIWVAKPQFPLTHDDYIGKTDFDFLNPDDARFLSDIKRRVINEEHSTTIDIPLLLQGHERVFEANLEPWRGADGKVIGIAGYVHDITERKQVENHLQQAHDELERRVNERTLELAKTVTALQKEVVERKKARDALKMEMQNRMRAVEELRENERLLIQQSRQAAMGEMIGNIAHQWRQPLNTLGLLIQGMQLSYELGEFSKGYLDGTVEKSMQLIQHMSQTIDDFRNFFKPNKEKVSFNLAESIRTTVSLIETSFGNLGIRIECDYGTVSGIMIAGYPNELSQVFLNILHNARDAFHERQTPQPLLKIRLLTRRGRAIATITDNAGGVPEGIIEKLFDPYFTTKGPVGTGVGLFMSKVIVEKSMNGRLTVRNTGNGAEFKLDFPSAYQETA